MGRRKETMQERWIEYAKKEDFNAWAKELSVSPLLARILKNRGVNSIPEAKKFLYGTMEDLLDPELILGMRTAAELLIESVKARKKIAIINDYDCDGIFSGQILYEGIKRIGGEAFVYTPDRVKDGYGLNRRLIDLAKADGCETIITCDNGISALEEVKYAKDLGFTVIVTDHHEPRTKEENGVLTAVLPEGDAVVDPKRPDETFPFRDLCGAGVVFYLMRLVFRLCDVWELETAAFYEYVGIATVADVVPITGENRILVKTGIEALKKTKNVPLRALISASSLDPELISTTTIGFVIAPAFNAIGRLSDTTIAFRFLTTKDPEEALELAETIRNLNDERKSMTEEGFVRAIQKLDKPGAVKKVIVVTLPDVHESIIGIIAGRLKERYHRPSFVLTKSETPGYLKGSGRSIETYHMANALQSVGHLLDRFGGHAGAAGLTIKEDLVDDFERELNESCTLSDEAFRPVVRIDARLPISYATKELAKELTLLEPCGVGNEKPLFARPHLSVKRMRLFGRNRNVLKMSLEDETGRTDEAIFFGDPEPVFSVIRDQYGDDTLQWLLAGFSSDVDLAFTFRPEVHTYRDLESVQLIVKNCCRIPK